MPEFKRATDFLDDAELAKAYLATRQEDLAKFMETIQRWEACNHGKAVRTVLYGNTVVHELQPRTLHASPCWGELFFAKTEDDHADTEIFWSFEQFAAYMLAKHW